MFKNQTKDTETYLHNEWNQHFRMDEDFQTFQQTLLTPSSEVSRHLAPIVKGQELECLHNYCTSVLYAFQKFQISFMIRIFAFWAIPALRR